MPVIKGVKAIVKLKPDTNQLEQVIITPVDPRGVMNALPVVWQKKIEESLKICADFNVHGNI